MSTLHSERSAGVHRKPVGATGAAGSLPPRTSSRSSSLTQSPPIATGPFPQQPTQTSPRAGSKQYPPVSLPSAFRANPLQQYQTPYQQQQQMNQQAMPKASQYYPPPYPPTSSMPTPSHPIPSVPPLLTQQQQYPQPQQYPQQQQQYPHQQQQYSQQQQHPISARRTLSNATTSTTSSNQGSTFLASNPSFSSSIRRSTSSRSNNTQSSYVALLRKQKATVWCDRSQHEDPRALAQLKAAKQRAQRELAGGPRNGGRTTTTTSGGLTVGVRNKIRHHGAVKASAYSAANLSGAGVPVRLSATEVDDEDDSSEGEREEMINNYARNSQSQLPPHHESNGSGRSSMGSNTRLGSLNQNNGRTSSSIGPEQYSIDSTNSHTTTDGDSYEQETPMPNRPGGAETNGGPRDYFAHSKRPHGALPGSDDSHGSNDSIGDEREFGHVAALPQRQQPIHETPAKTAEELRRRGSVDDRTMTMSAGRLFIANPDTDSD